MSDNMGIVNKLFRKKSGVWLLIILLCLFSVGTCIYQNSPTIKMNRLIRRAARYKNGYDELKRIAGKEKDKSIPILIIALKNEEDHEIIILVLKSIEEGAVESVIPLISCLALEGDLEIARHLLYCGNITLKNAALMWASVALEDPSTLRSGEKPSSYPKWGSGANK